MTNPKLAPSLPVNKTVLFINPGPIAEVAIKKAAPVIAPLSLYSFIHKCKKPSEKIELINSVSTQNESFTRNSTKQNQEAFEIRQNIKAHSSSI